MANINTTTGTQNRLNEDLQETGVKGAASKLARKVSSIDKAEIRDMASRLLTTDDVEPGVAEMTPMIYIECAFAEGTKLLVLFEPISLGHLPLQEATYPGQILAAEGEITFFEDGPSVTVDIRATAPPTLTPAAPEEPVLVTGRPPEEAGEAAEDPGPPPVPPQQGMSFELHYVNVTEDPILREAWVNLMQTESETPEVLGGVFMIGGRFECRTGCTS